MYWSYADNTQDKKNTLRIMHIVIIDKIRTLNEHVTSRHVINLTIAKDCDLFCVYRQAQCMIQWDRLTLHADFTD